jgi:hypothetical protein
MKTKQPPKGKKRARPPHPLEGGREALEREYFWAIALNGDRKRIDQLERMLTPAANDNTELHRLK